MRSRNNGGVIGAFQQPNPNYANGVFFIHDAAIYNTGSNPIWPLASGYIYSATGGTITNANSTYQSINSVYKVHTFTSNGTFTVVNGAGALEILLVGGGGTGGGGYTSGTNSKFTGGGGGGGGVVVVSTWVKGTTTFTVEVGATATVNSNLARANGFPSKVTSTAGHNYTAAGGGAGYISWGANIYTGYPTAIPDGGSGAGEGGYYQSGSLGGIGRGIYPGSAYINDTRQGYDGAFYVNASTTHDGAGGGGGASEPGYAANNLTSAVNAGKGGDGYLWPRTGLYYGAGGGAGRHYLNTEGITYGGARAGLNSNGLYTGGTGGYNSSSTVVGNGGNGTNGYGCGGGGGATNNASGGTNVNSSGGSGTVIFCYRYK
jgi:hypothetical protein